MEDFFHAAPDVPPTRDADADGITTAVESALQSFDEVFETFALDREEDYMASAQQTLQKRVHEQYEKLCSSFVSLMDETGHDALPESERARTPCILNLLSRNCSAVTPTPTRRRLKLQV